MRIAVLSDIHGFSLAFETVLRDLEEQGPFDEVIVAGDLCEGGPAPAEVVALLKARDFTVLQGNTDVEIVQMSENSWPRSAIGYTIDQLGPDGIAYLASLTFSHRITPPGGTSPQDDLLVVHANPRNLIDKFLPEMSDRALREVMGGAQAAVIAFGHHHICYLRQVDETLLVDVSAVGNPKDGDLRCKYGILTWAEGTRRWSATLRKLPYPLAETEAQIRASGLPNPEKVIKKLVRALY
jgi:predicted phosphodiesterase